MIWDCKNTTKFQFIRLKINILVNRYFLSINGSQFFNFCRNFIGIECKKKTFKLFIDYNVKKKDLSKIYP